MMHTKSFKDYLFTEKINLGVGVSGLASSWMTLKFANLMRKKFTEWDAFDLGVIDKRGNLLKQPKTSKEKRSMGMFENLVRKVKKSIIKYVGDSSTINILIALYLLKNESVSREHNLIKREIANELSNDEIELMEDILMKFKDELEINS